MGSVVATWFYQQFEFHGQYYVVNDDYWPDRKERDVVIVLPGGLREEFTLARSYQFRASHRSEGSYEVIVDGVSQGRFGYVPSTLLQMIIVSGDHVHVTDIPRRMPSDDRR